MKDNRILGKIRMVSEIIVGYTTTPIFSIFMISQGGSWSYIGWILLFASVMVNIIPSQSIQGMMEEYLGSAYKSMEEKKE